MKNFTKIKIGLFLMMLLFSFKLIAKIDSHETTTETKIITFHVTTGMKKLLSLKLDELGEYGLKANTRGGIVEVRLYAGYGYDYNHDRKNPNLLYGFTSSESDGLAYQQSSFISESYWPAYCLGGFNPFCYGGSTSYVDVYSTDLKKFKAKIVTNYSNSVPWYRLGNQTIELIVEISYSMKTPYSEFQYSLKLPGIDEMNQISVDELVRTQSVLKPPFDKYRFDIPISIPTTFKSIEQKEDTRFKFAYKFNLYSFEAFTFAAKFDDDQIIAIRVVKEKEKKTGVFTVDEANAIANTIAFKLGQLPTIARKGTDILNVFDNVNVTGITGAFYDPDRKPSTIFIDADESSNVLFHECIHASMNNVYFTSEFSTALLNNRTNISEYARSMPNVETISESFPAWLKLRYFTNFNIEDNLKIMDAIPGTIAYFDTHIKEEDIRPIPTANYQGPVAHEQFNLIYPTNMMTFAIGNPITFKVEKTGGTTVSGVSDDVTIELFANDDSVVEKFTSNSDVINVEWTPNNLGEYAITGRINYKDGYKSNIGIINISILESLPNDKIRSIEIKSSETTEKTKLKLYPNPSGGRFEIQFFVETYGNVECQIVDLQGRLIIEQKKFFESGQQHWLIDYKGKLAKGTYILAIKGMTKSESKLIIIE